MKDTENSWKIYRFQGGVSTTMHCVNKASRTGRSASVGVCVKYIWLN